MFLWLDEDKCTVPFHKHGCFKDDMVNPRPLPDLILNDRSSINWGDWDTYMPQLVCRCAKKAAELQYKYFSVQYYGMHYQMLIEVICAVVYIFYLRRDFLYLLSCSSIQWIDTRLNIELQWVVFGDENV